MTFSSILLISSEKESEKHLNTLNEVRNILGSRVSRDISIVDFSSSDLDSIDLVVVVGGDGTFIRTSHYLKDLPILGINSEPEQSVGEWMSLTANQLDLLGKIFTREFRIEEYCRIRAILNDKEIKELAINEIFVGAKNQYHTSRYFIEVGSEKEEHRSSGVLVVTKRGSTAWYKSAGGNPFFHDDLKYMVREILTTKIFDSDLTHGRVKDEIKITSVMNHRGVVVFDSNNVYKFNYGDDVVLKKSKFPLRVILI